MSAELKKAAAARAVAQVQSGMVVGLGTGSTTRFAVEQIIERCRAGELTGLRCVPTSEATAAQAQAGGLLLVSLAEVGHVDLAIDGADEVDPSLDLIKGLGGALLREKQVEQKARRFLCIVDESKLVARLGTKAPLPVELLRRGYEAHLPWLAALGCRPQLRGGEQPFVTDNGNYVVDCRFAGGIPDARALARELDGRAGVLAHGLFLDMASEVIVARPDGVQVLRRPV